MKLRWFLSRTLRQAVDLEKHVRKLFYAQRDILPPKAVQVMESALSQTRLLINSDADKEAIQKQMTALEKTANDYLKPYPHPGLRENIEVLLVAIAVAMAIRTFFIQPFKIPTGSMQPTLFGVTYENLIDNAGVRIPSLPVRVFDAVVHGTFYQELVADADGAVVDILPLRGFGVNMRTLVLQYADRAKPTTKTIWFAPDEDQKNSYRNLAHYSGISPGQTFKKGEPILKYMEKTGDHLFVDRLTYNFRHPHRGDIVVFKTHGIDRLTSEWPSNDNQFYIKRLVGLPDERISIGEDRHIRINGVPLDSSNPHFELLYGFDPKKPAMDSQYSGHTQLQFPKYPLSGNSEFQIGPKEYFVCGDNTVSSLDSRFWGSVPEKNIIGKSWFVYWPISDRFGWGQQ